MKSDNLSKELCEICGVPYIKTEDNCRVYNNDGELCEEYVYKLDFTKPENFTKLLNLPTETIIKNGQTIPAKNIWWIVNMDAKNCEALAPYYFEDLLIHLIVILENKYKIHNDEFVNSIKQAIRETEWVYD